MAKGEQAVSFGGGVARAAEALRALFPETPLQENVHLSRRYGGRVLLKREDLIPDQYADEDRQQVLIAELTRIFQRKEVREWMELFAGHDVCVTPLRGVAGAAHDEHLIDRGTIVTLKSPDGPFSQLGVFPKLSETPGSVGDNPPALGQHTVETLESAGVSKKDIDALIKSKVAAVAK